MTPARASPEPKAVADPGAARNTVLQLASQMVGAVCTSALTLYLVRSLGASGYGVYALALSIGALVLLPAGLGLPLAIGRFLAEHRHNVAQARAIFALGMRVQAPVAGLAGLALIALSEPLANAYGNAQLAPALRWMGAALALHAMFSFLTAVFSSVRRVSASLRIMIIESITEVSAAIALVAGGAGVAGAVLGRAIGYGVAVVAGLYITLRMFGGRRRGSLPAHISLKSVMSYSGALLLVDATWSAIARVDVLLIGAILSTAAVGSFSAVLRIMALVGMLGGAFSSGIAPRVARGSTEADLHAFNQGIRYLLIAQGLVIAPMLIWAKPIVDILFGPGYGSAVAVMQVLTVQAFVFAPASLISVAVSYLGEGRQRVLIMLATLVIGLICTYVLLQVAGLVGAAIADDIVAVIYISAHLWLCNRMITVDVQMLMRSAMRAIVAAAAMAVPLVVAGVDRLSPAGWILGSLGGVICYAAVLLASRELSVSELQQMASGLWRAARA